jgi:hypothetical protein
MADDDWLVGDYLRRLRRAARGLPRARRQELLDEIASHIAEARGPAGGASPEADGEGVRSILARLGEPGDIVRAAGGPAPTGRPGWLEITAVILLLVGGFVFMIGWVAGCLLLWASPRWRRTDKLLGTLVWPGGLLAPYLALVAGTSQCAAGPAPGACAQPQFEWLGIAVLVLAVAAEFAVAFWLLRRARRLPQQATTGADVAHVP